MSDQAISLSIKEQNFMPSCLWQQLTIERSLPKYPTFDGRNQQ